MPEMTKPWDYLIITAANDQQAKAYDFQIRLRVLLSYPAREVKVGSVDLLGSDAKIEFHQQPDGLHIHLPGSTAWAFVSC
jgi:hypothetical protein